MKLKLHPKWRLLKEGTIKLDGDEYWSIFRKMWVHVFLVGNPVQKSELVRRRVEAK